MDHEWWDWCETMWMCIYHGIDSKKSVCPRVELLLQGDHNDLAALSGHHSEKSCNLQGNNVFLSWQIKKIKTAHLRHWGLSYLANVCVVQGSIHFIQHKERGRTKATIKRRWSLVFSHIKNICICSQIILYKKSAYVFLLFFTCEWQRPKREQRWPSLLLTGCPWPWIVSPEPHSYSWCHPGRAHLDSPHWEWPIRRVYKQFHTTRKINEQVIERVSQVQTWALAFLQRFL